MANDTMAPTEDLRKGEKAQSPSPAALCAAPSPRGLQGRIVCRRAILARARLQGAATCPPLNPEGEGTGAVQVPRISDSRSVF